MRAGWLCVPHLQNLQVRSRLRACGLVYSILSLNDSMEARIRACGLVYSIISASSSMERHDYVRVGWFVVFNVAWLMFRSSLRACGLVYLSHLSVTEAANYLTHLSVSEVKRRERLKNYSF